MIIPTDRGPTAEAKQRYNAKLPEHVPGQHLWICMAMYRVRPYATKHFLDLENLLTIEGPGCYWCEQPYRPGMEATRCEGGPEKESHGS